MEMAFLHFLTVLSSILLVSDSENLHPITHQARVSAFNFVDVTQKVGLRPRPDSLKFGGPCVADLNADGIYDVIFSYHAQYPLQIYWGNGDGTFTKDPFSVRSDIHGINVAPRSARSQQRILSVNVGGGRATNLRPPQNYLITPQKKISNITHSFGLGNGIGRGRISLFMDLGLRSSSESKINGGGPDIVVTSFLGPKEDGVTQYGYENVNGNFKIRDLPVFDLARNGRLPVDVNGDGVMEIFSNRRAKIYQLRAPFKFEDVTDKFLNVKQFRGDTIAAIAEVDIDNDGVFEIYLARTRWQDIFPFGVTGDTFDVLLKRQRSRFVDVSKSARIPIKTRSVGVTVADFDNDGYVDIYVSVLFGKDMLLKNLGNGTFRRINGLVPKAKGVRSEHAVAVDYDEDGRVDLIVSQGGKKDAFGPYLVMRNLIPLTKNRHYLLIRVGHHPNRVVTALHAVVTVSVGGMKMVRRVGSPGAQAGGPSFLDTLHFGLGSFAQVDTVSVKWTAGKPVVKQNVAADQKVSFGIV